MAKSKLNRILIVCKGHSNIAGAQLYLKQISSLFVPPEYELHFAFREKDGARFFNEISRQCETISWEYDWRHLPFRDSFIQGRKLCRKVLPHLIIFNSTEDEILPVIWAAFLCRIPHRIMVSHWALAPDSLPLFRRKNGFPLPVPSRYSFRTRLIRGLAYHLLTRVIFVNTVTRKAYEKIYRLSADRCATIYNGIDVGQYSNPELRLKVRKELDINPDECMVLATGNLTAVKGYRFLIFSIRFLVEKGLPVKCFIAGHGELKEELTKQIVQEGLKRSVYLLGYRDDIPNLLAGADIFCMPSLNEALGYSLLEAIASGIPVIASNVGGIPEVVTNGKEGILVPPKDAQSLAKAIERLALNPELRSEMGKKARETAENRFSLQKMLSDTEEALTGSLS